MLLRDQIAKSFLKSSRNIGHVGRFEPIHQPKQRDAVIWRDIQLLRFHHSSCPSVTPGVIYHPNLVRLASASRFVRR